MTDPFEVRMRFTSQLQHLNASTSSAQKTANYALRHADHSDDLHSCILEQLERSSLNARANIMYFLPALAATARHAANTAYVRMMERDILRIVDLVAPDDGSGAANVKVVRAVLAALEAAGFLKPQTCRELEECIAGRDVGAAAGPDEDGDGAVASATPAAAAAAAAAREPGALLATGLRLDKRQIEQRIEEDRERHKRAREGIWAVAQRGTSLREDVEFERGWEEGSDVNEDDYALAREEAEERRKHLEFDDY